jgi:hypothetical protein
MKGFKFEIRRGKKGESHKFMCKVGGVIAIGANNITRLMALIQREAELQLDVEAVPQKPKTRTTEAMKNAARKTDARMKALRILATGRIPEDESKL